MDIFKSSSFKVGLLTLVAIAILVFTILWIKGRSFSSASRIEVHFKDINGMRAGSGVQMMGLRVGQVEEIIPVIDEENSYVKLKFVITEPGIKIPKASTISIQQSGLIGEQFLEITPPKIRTLYIPSNGKNDIYKDNVVQMKLDDKLYDVGKIKDVQVVLTSSIPIEYLQQAKISAKYSYKVDYYVDLPGLIIPEFVKGKFVTEKNIRKMIITPLDDVVISYPHQDSPYTVIEPMRIADFMDLQYKAAASLTETNQKINDILSDKVISDLKQSIVNINALTAQATTTMEKAEKLIDSSNEDIKQMIKLLDKFTNDFDKVTKIAVDFTSDPEFKPTVMEATQALTKLTNNLNKILDNTDAVQLAKDLNAIVNNVNEISSSINIMTKDKKLKNQVIATMESVNKAMVDLSQALELVNSMSAKDKAEAANILCNVAESAKNLRKFTDKLNKRFLLFRLMF